MIRVKNFIALMLLAMALIGRAAAFSFGSAKEDGGRPGAFLDFGASARSIGMGRAHAAVADDAGAVYWNPAGLAQIERKNIVSLYSLLPEDTSFGFFSYAHPTSQYGVFGLGVVSLQSAGFEKRSANREKQGSIDLRESALLLSQGYRFGSKLSAGSTLKVVRQDITPYSDTAFGLDLAFMYQLNARWQAGLSYKNLLSPTLKLKSVEEKMPRDIRAGLGWKPVQSLLLTTDVNKSDDQGAHVSAGVEWSPHSMLVLRGGMNNTELTTGMGFKMGDWALDYAFGYNNTVSGASSLGSSHRFGLQFSFGTGLNEVRAEERSRLVQKTGRLLLADLRRKMAGHKDLPASEINSIVKDINNVIRERGFRNTRDLYEAQGYAYFLQGKYARSVSYLSDAMSLGQGNQEDLQRYHDLATQKMNDEQKRLALDADKEILRQLVAQGEWRRASEMAERILTSAPTDEETGKIYQQAQVEVQRPIQDGLVKVRALFARKQYLEAMGELIHVRALDPENKEALLLTRRCMQALEDSAISESSKTPLVSKNSYNAEKGREFYSEGLKFYALGDLKNALAAWRQAVRHQPDHLAARNAFARAMAELNQPVEDLPPLPVAQATPVVEEKAAARQSAPAKTKTAKAAAPERAKKVNVKKMKKEIVEIVSIENPDPAKSRDQFRLGMLMSARGRKADALKYLKEAVRLDKNNTMARRAFLNLSEQTPTEQ